MKNILIKILVWCLVKLLDPKIFDWKTGVEKYRLSHRQALDTVNPSDDQFYPQFLEATERLTDEGNCITDVQVMEVHTGTHVELDATVSYVTREWVLERTIQTFVNNFEKK